MTELVCGRIDDHKQHISFFCLLHPGQRYAAGCQPLWLGLATVITGWGALLTGDGEGPGRATRRQETTPVWPGASGWAADGTVDNSLCAPNPAPKVPSAKPWNGRHLTPVQRRLLDVWLGGGGKLESRRQGAEKGRKIYNFLGKKRKEKKIK